MTDFLSVPLTALVDGVEIPLPYAYPGDAGMDLRAIESLEIKPFERALVSTRIALPFRKDTRASFSRVADLLSSKA